MFSNLVRNYLIPYFSWLMSCYLMGHTVHVLFSSQNCFNNLDFEKWACQMMKGQYWFVDRLFSCPFHPCYSCTFLLLFVLCSSFVFNFILINQVSTTIVFCVCFFSYPCYQFIQPWGVMNKANRTKVILCHQPPEIQTDSLSVFRLQN